MTLQYDVQYSHCRNRARFNVSLSVGRIGVTVSVPPNEIRVVVVSGAPNDNFRKNICSEGYLRPRIFETFVVKFLACLHLLGFSNM